jgi:trans-aconitate 2-methyltransferase
MLARALAEVPGVDWCCADISDWRPPSKAELIYSNAALHWLSDHEVLFPRLVSWLAPGGVLAVQMPRNFRAPSHRLIEEVVRAGRWRRRLEPLLRPEPVHEPIRYLDWLQPHAHPICIWETEYLHLLRGADPVKEWVKATWLKGLLDALDGEQKREFEAEYARLLRVSYPQRADGITPFPFKRLFIVAQKKW